MLSMMFIVNIQETKTYRIKETGYKDMKTHKDINLKPPSALLNISYKSEEFC